MIPTQNNTTDIQNLKARIMALVQSNELARARGECEELCRRQAGDAEGWFLHGAVCGQLGDYSAAVDCFTRTIAIRADNPAVYYNLGVVQHRLGQYPAAERSQRQAITLSPDFPDAHHELGNALYAQDEHERALESYRRAIALRPTFPAAYYNLGTAHFGRGDIDAAIESYQHAIRLDPGLVDAYYRLGVCASVQGRTADEIAMYRQLINLHPHHVDALNSLGLALKKTGKLAEAVECYRRAIATNPHAYQAHMNLGLALQEAGRLNEAETCFNESIRLAPDYAEGYYNLGGLLYFCNRLVDAEQAYRKAIALKPAFPVALVNLGNVFARQGRHRDAIASFRKALDVDPGFTDAQSNVLFMLNYILDCSAQEIWEEHQAFGRRSRELYTACRPTLSNTTDSQKRLRIGYISADFRAHATAYFLEPLLAVHNHDRYQIHCYASQTVEDAVTVRFRSYADCWNDISGLCDAAAAELIVRDGIDVLVDLSGHTHGGRLGVFARKPAPVQISWLGYLNTSGLDAMDYRIVDAVACPPGVFERYHSEKLLRMPGHQWCYRPPGEAPEVAPLPAATQGHVTFASVHNTAKITEPVLHTWLNILATVTQSRLLLIGNGLENRRARISALAREYAVEPDRIEYVPEQSFANYLALHGRIDINLDAFPYCGGTTTCHSLWMGVPVITLAGDTVISRGGASLMKVVGLDEWTAHSVDDYIALAVRHAADTHQLGKLRATLRERVQHSSLVDAESFVRDMETIYRNVWATWCDTKQSSP